MLRLTRTGLGLLTRQYRSVLRKCWLINVGLWQTVGDAISRAVSVPAKLIASLVSGGTMGGEAFNVLDEILLNRLFERKLASLTAIGLGIAAATMPGEALAEDITSRVVNTGTATYTDDTFTGIISSSLDGGAVYNEKTGTISFNNTGFEGNVGINGGALYNRGRVDSLSGGFSYNHATSSGGAIYQKSAGTMGDITADFTQNYVASTGIGKGGAIYNAYQVSNITGNFTNNYVNAVTGAEGGAIKQSGRYAQAGNIVGNFISNYVTAASASGGAMNMDGTVGNISGDFVGNTATSNGNGLSDTAKGGAVMNNANITSITGNFTNNLAQATGTYVPETTWYVPEGKGWEDKVEVQIPATVTTVAAMGGALVNQGPVSIGEISGSFSGNAAKSASGNAFGGGIYNNGGTFTNGIVNSSFTDNYARTDSSSADVSAHGGAIWTNSDLILKATNSYNMLFSGNYVEKAGVKTPEAIWLELNGDEYDKRKCGENGTNCLTLTLNTSNGGTMRFDDQINGDSGYKIQITNDGTGGQVVFNNSIKAEKRYEYGTTAAHADIQLGNTSSLKLGADNVLSGNNLSLAASNTATLDLRNGAAGNTSLKSLTLGNSSKLYLAVDADLSNAVADRLTADSYTWNSGSVMINAISLATLSAADSVEIQLVDPSQTSKYSVDSSIVNDPTLKTYYSTIAYNPGTGKLNLGNKTTYAPINLVGSWSSGNYITRYNASDSGATSVGANLKLLDDAIGTWNNEVAGSNLVLYDANNASATGVGANMMLLDRAVVAVKNDLNTANANLAVTNSNLANNYYTKSQAVSNEYIKVNPRASGAVDAIAYGGGDIAIGDYSIAGTSGENSDAMALGTWTEATGLGSTALGSNATATGYRSVALGSSAQATGRQSTALGQTAKAAGSLSIAFGNTAEASGYRTIALGSKAQAGQDLSTALGGLSTTTLANTISVGNASTGLYRQIMNVADGRSDYDAVNVNQLKLSDNGNYVVKEIASNNYHYEGQVTVNYTSGTATAAVQVVGDFDMTGVDPSDSDAVQTKIEEIVNGAWSSTTSGTYGTYNPYVTSALDADGNNVGKTIGTDTDRSYSSWTAPSSSNFVQVVDSTPLSENLLALDSAIGVWNDNARTIGGHTYTSNLIAYDATSPAATSVGVNLVRLDEAILGVKDTLAGFDWLATTATGSAASASMDGTAIGYNSEATQVGSVALGYNAKATGTNGTTAIGSGANATGTHSTAVGKQAQATVVKATALGNGAVVLSEGSVALGYGSKTGSDTYVVSVGSGIASHSATDQYRRIINVADGVNAHDAMTIGQLGFNIASTPDHEHSIYSSVADYVSNNYYRKLLKKDEILGESREIEKVMDSEMERNSSEKKIIKGMSAFPSILCTYPFDMPHAANDNQPTIILAKAI